MHRPAGQENRLVRVLLNERAATTVELAQQPLVHRLIDILEPVGTGPVPDIGIQIRRIRAKNQPVLKQNVRMIQNYSVNLWAPGAQPVCNARPINIKMGPGEGAPVIADDHVAVRTSARVANHVTQICGHHSVGKRKGPRRVQRSDMGFSRPVLARKRGSITRELGHESEQIFFSTSQRVRSSPARWARTTKVGTRPPLVRPAMVHTMVGTSALGGMPGSKPGMGPFKRRGASPSRVPCGETARTGRPRLFSANFWCTEAISKRI